MWNQNNPGELVAEPGMTLRDYFAGQALLTFDHNAINGMVDSFSDAPPLMARMAYHMADAMIAEREAPHA